MALDSDTLPAPRAETSPDTARGADLSPVRRSGARRLRVLCACRHWIDWREAEYVGAMRDEVANLELRNCPRCGSTRAVEVGGEQIGEVA